MDNITFHTHEITVGEWQKSLDQEKLITDLIKGYFKSRHDEGLRIKVWRGLYSFEIKCFLNAVEDHQVLFECMRLPMNGQIAEQTSISNAFGCREVIERTVRAFMDQGCNILWKDAPDLVTSSRANTPIPEHYGDW